MPHILQGFRQGLLFHGMVDVAGIPRKYKLIVVVLFGQHPRHPFIRQHPVVFVVPA